MYKTYQDIRLFFFCLCMQKVAKKLHMFFSALWRKERNTILFAWIVVLWVFLVRNVYLGLWQQPKPLVDIVTGSWYVDYTPQVLADALVSGKTVIAFFHADWCPSCRILDKVILANIQNIPENVQIIRVDYDSTKVLQKKWWVRAQTSLVLVWEDWEAKDFRVWAFSLSDVLSLVPTS